MKTTEIFKMTKELCAEQEFKISQKEIKIVADALFEAIVAGVKADGKVKLNEVTYSLKEVPERSGKFMMGDKKGETWTKPAHTVITVKASKKLKEMA